jgi:hypothetical protein
MFRIPPKSVARKIAALGGLTAVVMSAMALGGAAPAQAATSCKTVTSSYTKYLGTSTGTGSGTLFASVYWCWDTSTHKVTYHTWNSVIAPTS